MKIPQPYRGVAYSVSKQEDGHWKWTLHPRIVPNTSGPITQGLVSGTQDDAIAAAEAAIDAELARD